MSLHNDCMAELNVIEYLAYVRGKCIIICLSRAYTRGKCNHMFVISRNKFIYIGFLAIDAGINCPDSRNICSKHAQCVFANSNFACACNSGFEGDGNTCSGNITVFAIISLYANILSYTEIST